MHRTTITVKSLALFTGTSPYILRRACEEGRFQGAYFDRVTWQWIIPYPVKLANPA